MMIYKVNIVKKQMVKISESKIINLNILTFKKEF